MRSAEAIFKFRSERKKSRMDGAYNLRETFEKIFFEDKPVKLVFSSKRRKSLEYSKVNLRPVAFANGISYQAEFVFDKKVTHVNIPPNQAAEFCLSLVEKDFKEANIFTDSSDIHIMASKPQSPRITRKPATLSCKAFSHNREKNYIIPDGEPCDFLIRLGVMDRSGKVFPRHYGKFRQINRYLEIVDDVFPYLSCGTHQSASVASEAMQPEETSASCRNANEAKSSSPLRIIDFGCGKAYLTFAIYYYLKVKKGLEVEIIGLDLKTDVINFCNSISKELGYEGLKFLRGDIADYTSDYADMVVTLHACDTATDYALINAVSWNTKVILSVPCCQHELFSQIKNHIHQPMLKHGILKDRLTEYLTDGLRGLKLESKGYDVAMIEFTSLEHTARNIMIKAVKKYDENGTRALKAQSQYQSLCDFYGVSPTIGEL